MADDFDVYFAGVCLPGFSTEDVAQGMARTFKLSEEAAAALMDGKPHRIKAACDKPTALKYRQVIAGIGGKVDVVRHGAPPPNAPIQDNTETPVKAIKSLVSGPAEFGSRPPKAPHDPGAGAVDRADESIPWEAPGKPAETQPQTVELSVAPVGSLLADETKEEPYKLINVPDFDVAAAGEVIPTLPDDKKPLNPKTDHLHIEPLDDN
ncbi:MAG: hypothetical protein V2I45_11745 [Halieaceae bacterium]|nr:hypothetical protein [Halieaceae bacterium]